MMNSKKAKSSSGSKTHSAKAGGRSHAAVRTPALKVLRALTWIVQEKVPDVGVREMAVGLGVSPSTAHRLLSELVRADFVKHQPQTGRYSLSLEFLRLAHLTTAHVPLEHVALTHMRRLTEACNETSLLGVYDSMRGEMMFLAMVNSTHQLRYSIELNQWMPVYVGASGLAIMAFLSEAEIGSIIDRTRLAPVTPRSITQRYRLEAELQKIRTHGYAVTRGQRTPDAVGLAAPVFGSTGEVIADICLTVPESRYEPASERRIVELLRNCAEEVTKAIGGHSSAHKAA